LYDNPGSLLRVEKAEPALSVSTKAISGKDITMLE
jgi:hypothetical protein